jgi:hypothetical protein
MYFLFRRCGRQFFVTAIRFAHSCNEVLDITRLNGNINAHPEWHVESDPGIVNQATVDANPNFEEPYEYWIQNEHVYEFEGSRGAFDFVASRLVGGPIMVCESNPRLESGQCQS